MVINSRKLILFVGADVLKLCGLPLWWDLAVGLFDYSVHNPKCEIINHIEEINPEYLSIINRTPVF